ncbi:MAG TPA: DUF2877 domain-containing protein [Clostridia bacterium]|nr:DUF2877 domain-containing protein [Clostridia bacterium]
MKPRKLAYGGLSIASDLQQFLLARPVLDLRVHSVFATSINLLTGEGELVTFASSGRDIMPMGMVARVPSVGVWGLEAGDTVSCEGRMVFNLPRGAGSLLLRQARVRWVSLSEPLDDRSDHGKTALDRIKTKLLAGHRDGISPLIAWLPESDTLPQVRMGNAYCTYIHRDLGIFLQMLLDGNAKQAVAFTEKLIGFGPGLTPSCDDFLAGIMLSLFYENREDTNKSVKVHEYLDHVVAMARGRTTLVSYHMLRHAAGGRANQAYLELLRAVVEGDLGEIDSLIDRVLAYGASSGADFLFGLYCAQKILTGHIKNSERFARIDFEENFVKGVKK